jgi:hypothetical protein
MLDLATVRCEEFAACLNQDFEIVFTDGTLPVKLSEARPRGPAGINSRAVRVDLSRARWSAFAAGHL